MNLANPKGFFDVMRAKVFDGWLSSSQVAGINALIAAAPDAWPKSWVAAYLAEPVWETNHSMQCVREAYWLSEEWRKAHLRYFPFYGRGFDQMTWERNYAFFAKLFGVDCVNNPDLALDPMFSAKRLVYGMENGTYTGKKLADFLPADGSIPTVAGESALYWCREVINGVDKAAPIASIAENILEALNA